MNIAMKAAPSSEQLQDRISKLTALGRSPVIELYLDGIDLNDNSLRNQVIQTCNSLPCQYIVHVPNIDFTGRLFDFANEDWREWINWASELAATLNSTTLVVHYFCGHEQELDKEEATLTCLERIAEVASLYSTLTFLVENYGLVFYSDNRSTLYYPASPLDHFFPWDIGFFHRYMSSRRVENVKLLLDTAHAALSCNMFNALRQDQSLRSDQRFRYIGQDDLDRISALKIMDYVEAGKFDAVHISDAYVLDKRPFSKQWLQEAITTEGLPLGAGHLPIKDITMRLLQSNQNITFVTEILEDDFTQANNQKEAAQFLLTLEQRV